MVFCFSNVLKSQDEADFKSFSFGLKAIPSLSWFKTESNDLKNASAKLNFGYGLVTEFHFAPNYGLLTGIEINDNGGNFDYTNKDVYYFPDGDTIKFFVDSRKYAIKYLNIPIVLKLKTNEIGFLKYFGQFGIDAGFRLKARATDQGRYENNTNPSTKSNVIIDSDVSLLRFGLNVGLGAEYNLVGNTSLLVGVNYNNGFSNFLKSESNYLMKKTNTTDEWFKQKAYNNYVTLTVGVLF